MYVICFYVFNAFEINESKHCYWSRPQHYLVLFSVVDVEGGQLSWVINRPLGFRWVPGFHQKLLQPEINVVQLSSIGVRLKVSGSDLSFWVGFSGCGFVLGDLRRLCLLKQQASSVQWGWRSHAGSVHKGIVPPLALTHARRNSWRAQLLTWTTAKWKGGLFLSPLSQYTFCCRDALRPVCALMWPLKKKKKMFNQTGRDDFPHRCLVCVEPPFWLQVICHYDSRNVDLSTLEELHFLMLELLWIR